MSTSKKYKKAGKPLTKPLNPKKQVKQSIAVRVIKIFLVILLGIVLALGIMARLYHYNKYEIHQKNKTRYSIDVL